MKKIMYLDHTSKWSGGEIALFRTLTSIDRSENIIEVVLSEHGPFSEKLKSVNIPVSIYPVNKNLLETRKENYHKMIKQGILWLKYSIELSKLMKASNAHILHCNSLKSDIFGGLAGRMSNIPVIWHIRDHINSQYLPKNTANLFGKLALKIPKGLIFNSESTKLELLKNKKYNQKCQVIYDGLTEQELKNSFNRDFLSWPNQKIRIGMIGRIVEWKGQHIFIDAAIDLIKKGIDANFIIVGSSMFGEDEYENKIKKKSSEYGNQIKFMGFRSDISEILSDLDILVHCSILPEPFGQVVIEGMAEGLPVVASDAGGVKEIITQNIDGIRTPLGDTKALASSLENLIENPKKASLLGRAAYSKVREKFTALQSAQAFEAFYSELG